MSLTLNQYLLYDELVLVNYDCSLAVHLYACIYKKFKILTAPGNFYTRLEGEI